MVELIANARREFGWGACRIRLWLLRVYQVKAAPGTISLSCDDLRLPRPRRPKRRRATRQLKLFEKATPDESVQIDVKLVKVGGAKAYQYTTLNDCTRLRVLRLRRRLHVVSSLDFLGEVVRAFPCAIRRIQTDHGPESSVTFVLAVERRGMRHPHIRPRCSEENGRVERSHRIDEEGFWSRQGFDDFETAAAQLGAWERMYNGGSHRITPP